MDARSSKTEKSGLFSPQIPMKKSILINDEGFLLDFRRPSTASKPANIETSSNASEKQSSIYITGISYPGTHFLAKKLKRIVHFYLLRSFHKIKIYRRPIINLNLVNSFYKRALASAYFSIKIFVQTKKQNKLSQVITRNTKPNLLFHCIERKASKNKKDVLKQFKKYILRKKRIENFINLLNNAVKNYDKTQLKAYLFRELKYQQEVGTMRLEGAKNILRFIPKIMKRIKMKGFKQILQGLKIQKLENTQSAKKRASTMLNENSAQRVKTLNNQRQKIRDIKNFIDSSASDRSKVRYQLRRELNALRTKMRQEQKKNKLFVQSIEIENTKLSFELDELRQQNSKRLQRINSKITEEFVKSMYQKIEKEQENHMGEIKLKSIQKEKSSYLGRIEKIDEYHVYWNQKLRQQLFEYENIGGLKSVLPQQVLIEEENKTLKEMMRCMIWRGLENHKLLEVVQECSQ